MSPLFKLKDGASTATKDLGSSFRADLTVSSSYEPTSATAGHEPTAAPIKPGPGRARRLPPAWPRCLGRAASAPGQEQLPSGAPSRGSPSNSQRSARPPSAGPGEPSNPIRHAPAPERGTRPHANWVARTFHPHVSRRPAMLCHRVVEGFGRPAMGPGLTSWSANMIRTVPGCG